ncbi:MAG: hypothetical protein U0324_09045 [Polyangiales bacterium]
MTNALLRLAAPLVVAALCGCKQPVVPAGDRPPGAAASGGATPSTPAPCPTPTGGTARGGLLQRGQALEGVLAREESHDFQIELRGRETLHFQVTGATEAGPGGERCPEWSWEWRTPDDRWSNGNPGPLENGDRWAEPRTFEVDLANVVGVDETQPGRWTFRLKAGAGCHRIRYRVALR